MESAEADLPSKPLAGAPLQDNSQTIDANADNSPAPATQQPDKRDAIDRMLDDLFSGT